MLNTLLCVFVGTILAAFVSGLEFCTDSAGVSSWGVELAAIDLSDQETLQFYTIGDWGVVNCTEMDCMKRMCCDKTLRTKIHTVYTFTFYNRFRMGVGIRRSVW